MRHMLVVPVHSESILREVVRAEANEVKPSARNWSIIRAAAGISTIIPISILSM